MASITMKRGTKAEIEATQILDGQLLMETDQLNNNKMYLDLPDGTRVPVGGSGAWVGTQAEFDTASQQGEIAEGTQVIITDDYDFNYSAQEVTYTNSTSGLSATNVQGAIDELDNNLETTIDETKTDLLNLINKKANIYQVTWNYSATTFTLPDKSWSCVIMWAARGVNKAMFILLPSNNNEITTITNGFGTTITHGWNNGTHTITLTPSTSPVGTAVVLNFLYM